MRNALLIVVFGGTLGFAMGCGKIGSIPGLSSHDESGEIPVNPIVVEGEADAKTSQGEEGEEAAPKMLPPETVDACLNAAAARSVTVSNLPVISEVTIDSDAFVKIVALQASIAINVTKPIGILCVEQEGIASNIIEINAAQNVGLLRIDPKPLYSVWTVTTAAGAKSKIELTPLNAPIGTITFEGPSTYNCPDAERLKFPNNVICR